VPTHAKTNDRGWDQVVEEYHRQYREACKTWSVIPYEQIITRIKQLSPRLQIGDFGCGEAKILEALGDKRVYSFDHVAINWLIAKHYVATLARNMSWWYVVLLFPFPYLS
jgi:hypothetical protein